MDSDDSPSLTEGAGTGAERSGGTFDRHFILVVLAMSLAIRTRENADPRSTLVAILRLRNVFSVLVLRESADWKERLAGNADPWYVTTRGLGADPCFCRGTWNAGSFEKNSPRSSSSSMRSGCTAQELASTDRGPRNGRIYNENTVQIARRFRRDSPHLLCIAEIPQSYFCFLFFNPYSSSLVDRCTVYENERIIQQYST